MSPLKNVYELWHKDETQVKKSFKTKTWLFDFLFLVLASYNNIYYRYESLLIHFLIN